jgi:hypothetical protein
MPSLPASMSRPRCSKSQVGNAPYRSCTTRAGGSARGAADALDEGGLTVRGSGGSPHPSHPEAKAAQQSSARAEAPARDLIATRAAPHASG